MLDIELALPCPDKLTVPVKPVAFTLPLSVTSTLTATDESTVEAL